jgi:putative phosphoesterase
VKILIISDTHGNFGNLFKAFEAAGRCDAVIHLGDGEEDTLFLSGIAEDCRILKVAGNCDLYSDAPRELWCQFENFKIFICHGDRFGVKAGIERLAAHGKANLADIVLYGHTHQARSDQIDGLHLLNPGSLSGRAAFLSYATLELDNSSFKATIHRLQD